MTKPIAEKICEFRKARSLTQAELGEKLGVSSQAVSKWENGESMPDILLLPQLCTILGVTADALLEVPTSVKGNSCMSALAAYAKDAGGVKASFEALKACTNAVDEQMRTGSAYQCYDGIRIYTESGIGLVVHGETAMKAIRAIDPAAVAKTCELLLDESVLAILPLLDFGISISAADLAAKSNLPTETVEHALFNLMKHGYCECHADGGYVFGGAAYALLAVLGGLYFTSPAGRDEVNSLTRNYPPRER